MTPPIFSVRGLAKSYGPKEVLRGLDFHVDQGEALVIMGRSGSGKSVALRQLIGLERADAGEIVFDGENITRFSERELYAVRRRVAMLFQSGALFDSMTVFGNVSFPLREHTDLTEDEIKEVVKKKLALVRLEGVEERYPSALSGGMKKRVALARSLALDPKVVLFDEPTTGLDPVTSATIAHLMRSSQQEMGTTSVVVTHDIPLARSVGDRVGFLDEGRFTFLGTWEEADNLGETRLSRFLAGQPEEVEHVA